MDIGIHETGGNALLRSSTVAGFPCSRKPATHLHIPTPGDHYSPATGSAIMTVIHQLAMQHDLRSGKTLVAVSKGTKHDYPVGECVEVAFTTPPQRWKRGIDSVSARLGWRRTFGEMAYNPFIPIVQEQKGCEIFVHNSPAPVRMLRRNCPGARLHLWLHNDVFSTYSGSEVREVAEAVDTIICCSDYIRRGVTHRMGKAMGEIHVVHNGVDRERFYPPAESAGQKPPVILFLGRMLPIKGPDLLLKAAVKLFSEGIRFRLRMVGSQNFNARDPLSDFERSLRSIAAPLGSAVEFVPFVSRDGILAEYQNATIFCAPSNWDEPFGLTIAEAMACGLPIVTSRRGGIPEFAGEAVHYFNPPDFLALAERLKVLLRDGRLREELGVSARKKAERFTATRQYDRLSEVLNRANLAVTR